MTMPLEKLRDGDAVAFELVDGSRVEGVLVGALTGGALVVAIANERTRIAIHVEDLRIVWRLA